MKCWSNSTSTTAVRWTWRWCSSAPGPRRAGAGFGQLRALSQRHPSISLGVRLSQRSTPSRFFPHSAKPIDQTEILKSEPTTVFEGSITVSECSFCRRKASLVKMRQLFIYDADARMYGPHSLRADKRDSSPFPISCPENRVSRCNNFSRSCRRRLRLPRLARIKILRLPRKR